MEAEDSTLEGNRFEIINFQRLQYPGNKNSCGHYKLAYMSMKFNF